MRDAVERARSGTDLVPSLPRHAARAGRRRTRRSPHRAATRNACASAGRSAGVAGAGLPVDRGPSRPPAPTPASTSSAGAAPPLPDQSPVGIGRPDRRSRSGAHPPEQIHFGLDGADCSAGCGRGLVSRGGRARTALPAAAHQPHHAAAAVHRDRVADHRHFREPRRTRRRRRRSGDADILADRPPRRSVRPARSGRSPAVVDAVGGLPGPAGQLLFRAAVRARTRPGRTVPGAAERSRPHVGDRLDGRRADLRLGHLDGSACGRTAGCRRQHGHDGDRLPRRARRAGPGVAGAHRFHRLRDHRGPADAPLGRRGLRRRRAIARSCRDRGAGGDRRGTGGGRRGTGGGRRRVVGD